MIAPVPTDDPRIDDTARAIRDGYDPPWPPWEQLSPGAQNQCRQAARYALARLDAETEEIR